jgi:hypothetical protein
MQRNYCQCAVLRQVMGSAQQLASCLAHAGAIQLGHWQLCASWVRLQCTQPPLLLIVLLVRVLCGQLGRSRLLRLCWLRSRLQLRRQNIWSCMMCSAPIASLATP